MSYQPHYIASYEQDSGLNTYYEPFLIPDKAFAVLEDAYCFRGKIRKRKSFQQLGRLRRELKIVAMGNITAGGAGTFTFNIFTGMGLLATEPYAQIENSLITPISIAIGAPISQTLTDPLGTGTLTIAGAGPITSGTINYSTGVLTLVFSGIAGVSAATITGAYYPCLPVMGIRRRELVTVDKEDSIFFDQKYAYRFNSTTKMFEELVLGTIWHSSNSDSFWSTNYVGFFWVTNSHMTGTRDPMRFYNGITWTDFAPLTTAADTLYNAEIILPYKGRFVFLNTWEGTTIGTITGATNFGQRARWSSQANPTGVDEFRTDIVGKGGYFDAPTSETIVGAEFIKDTLVVKFEKSSWKLVDTGNAVLPFMWQKINTELGAMSKFSLIPFDRGVLAVANYGLTSDDSVNVERIDLQIPQAIFNINADFEGAKRVHGIRDFYDELCYWTIPNSAPNAEYPDVLLVYNYRNNTYAKFNDSFTALGYWQRENDLTWAELTAFNWAGWTTTWESGVSQSFFPNIVAGNQQGFVLILNQFTINDPSLSIWTIDFTLPIPEFTSYSHNLSSGDIIRIDNATGTASALNGRSYRVTQLSEDTFTVVYYDPIARAFYPITGNLPSPSPLDIVDATTIYLNFGVINKVNSFEITTKIFTPFYEQGAQCRLGYVDFLLDRTANGSIVSNVEIDECNSLSMTDQVTNPSLLGSNVVLTGPENLALYPFQTFQKKIWHRQFVQSIAQNFQVQLTMSDVQTADLLTTQSDVVLHAMTFYLTPNARLTP